MDYQKIYDELVARCVPRGLDKTKHEGYFEIHHIIPKCLGGSDEKSNLVMFTGREHFIAHLLLYKIHPNCAGLTYSAFMMGYTNKNSKNYQTLKEKVAHLNSNKNLGKLKVDYTGYKFGRLLAIEYFPEYIHKERRIPKWRCICECGNTCFVATQLITTQRVKSCGCLATESKSKRFKGLEKSSDTRMKISETLKSKNLNPWENTRLGADGLHKWSVADQLYEIWLNSGKLKSKNFTTLLNSQNNTNYSRSYYKTLVRYFIGGWVPLEDEEWIKFSKGN